jgi:hypothetical protein
VAACEREAVQPALGTPAVYCGGLQLSISERREDFTTDERRKAQMGTDEDTAREKRISVHPF